MKSYAIIALAGVAAALPQGVTEKIAPSAPAPDSCKTSYPDPFSISIMNVTTSAPSKRHLISRQEPKVLTITLADGVLTDDLGRTGYIAANNQFQFDKPAQTGAVYTSGWSVCSNGTLALGNSAIFYQCLSGDFYNLYDKSTGEQCSPIYINILKAGGQAAAGGASQIGDGQLQAATSTAGAVSQISDGQIQATTSTAAPVTQISDGQIQASTAGVAVTQISDGQIQAATSPAAGAVSQISDGQIQAPTATPAPVTQIGDGQIQAPTGKPVTQISDGQIQAPTGKPVTQIGDGQIQAPAGTMMPVPSRNATGVAVASPSVSVYTGAASLPTFAAQAIIAAGAFAVAML